MADHGDFCSFTKAVEHLGDRWSLLILRELAMHGSLGFNALVDVLPGISRSTLAARMRKLHELGLVSRVPGANGRQAPYALATAGQELLPTLFSLRSWAERWVPEDPGMAERDPDVIGVWLAKRVDRAAAPAPAAVIALSIRDGEAPLREQWLVVEHEAPASICLEDPGLAEGRYVFADCDVRTLFAIARGHLGWQEASDRRSVQLYGEPGLVRDLPEWFLPATSGRSRTEAGRFPIAASG